MVTISGCTCIVYSKHKCDSTIHYVNNQVYIRSYIASQQILQKEGDKIVNAWQTMPYSNKVVTYI